MSQLPIDPAAIHAPLDRIPPANRPAGGQQDGFDSYLDRAQSKHNTPDAAAAPTDNAPPPADDRPANASETEATQTSPDENPHDPRSETDRSEESSPDREADEATPAHAGQQPDEVIIDTESVPQASVGCVASPDDCGDAPEEKPQSPQAVVSEPEGEQPNARATATEPEVASDEPTGEVSPEAEAEPAVEEVPPKTETKADADAELPPQEPQSRQAKTAETTATPQNETPAEPSIDADASSTTSENPPAEQQPSPRDESQSRDTPESPEPQAVDTPEFSAAEDATKTASTESSDKSSQDKKAEAGRLEPITAKREPAANESQQPSETRPASDERTAATRPSARDAAAPHRGTATETVDTQSRVQFVQRVAKAFQAAGNQGGEVRLRLSPPELGSLRVEITVERSVLTARIEAETPQARTMLLDNLPALRERLSTQDIKVARFDIDLMDHDASQSNDRRWDEHDTPHQPRTQPQNTTDRPTADGPRPQSTTSNGDGSLNVVI